MGAFIPLRPDTGRVGERRNSPSRARALSQPPAATSPPHLARQFPSYFKVVGEVEVTLCRRTNDLHEGAGENGSLSGKVNYPISPHLRARQCSEPRSASDPRATVKEPNGG